LLLMPLLLLLLRQSGLRRPGGGMEVRAGMTWVEGMNVYACMVVA